jgi:hypothetical protein
VVQAILAIIAHVNIGPAVIVVIGHAHPIAPAIIGDAGLFGHVRKRAIVVVVKQRSLRRWLLAVQCVKRGAIHQVDVQPAIVVVVNQAHAGAVGFYDESLVRHAHLVDPAGKAGLFGHVFKHHGAGVNETAGRDGALLLVIHRGCAHTAGNAARAGWGLSGGGRSRLLALRRLWCYRLCNQNGGGGSRSALAGFWLGWLGEAIAGKGKKADQDTGKDSTSAQQQRKSPHGLQCIARKLLLSRRPSAAKCDRAA